MLELLELLAEGDLRVDVERLTLGLLLDLLLGLAVLLLRLGLGLALLLLLGLLLGLAVLLLRLGLGLALLLLGVGLELLLFMLLLELEELLRGV